MSKRSQLYIERVAKRSVAADLIAINRQLARQAGIEIARNFTVHGTNSPLGAWPPRKPTTIEAYEATGTPFAGILVRRGSLFRRARHGGDVSVTTSHITLSMESGSVVDKYAQWHQLGSYREQSPTPAQRKFFWMMAARHGEINENVQLSDVRVDPLVRKYGKQAAKEIRWLRQLIGTGRSNRANLGPIYARLRQIDPELVRRGRRNPDLLYPKIRKEKQVSIWFKMAITRQKLKIRTPARPFFYLDSSARSRLYALHSQLLAQRTGMAAD